MDSIRRLSNHPQSIVYTSGLKWTRLYFRFHLSTRLHWTPGFVHWNLVESIGDEYKVPQHLDISDIYLYRVR